MPADQDTMRFDTRMQSHTGSPRKTTRQSTRMFLYLQLVVTDCLALTVGLILPSLFLGTVWRPYSGAAAVVMLIPLYIIFALNDGTYSLRTLRRPVDGLRLAWKALGLAILSILILAFILQSGDVISRLTFGFGAVASGIALGISRLAFARYVRVVTEGRLTNELLIIDGVPQTAPTKAVVIDASRIALTPDANDPRMLQQFGLLTKGFDRVVIDCDPSRRAAWALLLKSADVNGELLIAQFNEIGAIAIMAFEGTDTVMVSRATLSVRERAKKRFLDLAVAIPLLIALAPLLLIVAIAVRTGSPGPILFKQDRVGRGNRLFKVLKFRSMRNETSDSAGTQSTRRDDDRVTRVGKLIRKTSIDELPQLINVLLGDMSLVGPRPHALGSTAGDRLFWEIDQTYWHRHRLKPGITGLAQIRGYRGATHESLDLTNRLQADLEYMEGWSIWRDISILINTFRVMRHRNAY